jgi:ribosomal protein L37E
MGKKKTEKVRIVCTKCGESVTADMIFGKSKSCPACGEPDRRYFELSKEDQDGGKYPEGEEEEST